MILPGSYPYCGHNFLSAYFFPFFHLLAELTCLNLLINSCLLLLSTLVSPTLTKQKTAGKTTLITSSASTLVVKTLNLASNSTRPITLYVLMNGSPSGILKEKKALTPPTSPFKKMTFYKAFFFY